MKMARVFGMVVGMLTVLSGGSMGNVYGQVVYTDIKSFTWPVGEVEPVAPIGGVIEGSDGALYGTSSAGLYPATYGTVYKINKDGSGFKIIKAFTQVAQPLGRVLEGADGYLYGTTWYGETIFKINKDGSDFVELHHFENDVEHDGSAVGALVQGGNGALYGVTSRFGYGGVMFRLNADGTGYTNLHRFTGGNSDGFQPSGGLLLATNGYVYGSTTLGGEFNSGTLFKINQDGSGYEVIKAFSSTDGGGNRPWSALVQGSDGFLYGGTRQVNSNNAAAIFRVGLDGSGYTVIRQFDGSVGSEGVFYSMTFGLDGKLYVMLNGAIYRMDLDGSNLVLLKSFTRYDGAFTDSTLLFGSDGMLYGTAQGGGINGKGTLYRLNTDGSDFEVLKYMISPGGGAAQPKAPLLLSGDGNLYGTTLTGGATNVGAIFKVGRDGSGYALLKSFGTIDGQAPMAGLVEGADGGLYGTTSGGGSNGLGVVFKMNKDGSAYRVLWHFTGAPDGNMTNAAVAPGLTMDANQVLYGVTPLGGSNQKGTIFRINSDGTGYGILKNFTGSSQDGEVPETGLLLGADGALYGTTVRGGSGNTGVIFKIQRDGNGFTVLRSIDNRVAGGFKDTGRLVEDGNGILYGTFVFFDGGFKDGVFKIGREGSNYSLIKTFQNSVTEGTDLRGLVRGIDGSLYGTAYSGGSSNRGAVFRLSPDGKNFSLLKSFTGTNGDGSLPWSVLTAGSDGTLYCTTSAGGDSGAGSVFRLEPAVAISGPIKTNNGIRIRMTTGIPGRTYTVERATSLAGPWTGLTQLKINTNGVSDFQDLNAPQDGAFYRTTYP